MDTLRMLPLLLATTLAPLAVSGGPVSTADLLEVVDESWFAEPGVHEVTEPRSGRRYLVATGTASLSVKLSRSAAERMLAARARMDAVRRILERHQEGLTSNVIIEAQPRGIILLAQRSDEHDPATLLVTLALPVEAVSGMVTRSVPSRPPASQPASQPAPPSAPEPGGLAGLARTLGMLGGTVRDAMVTGPDELAREARAALEAEDLAQADERIQRLARITVGEAVLKDLRAEASLRRDLQQQPDAYDAVIALATWAEKHHRLAAVVKPLERSVRLITERAGAEVFVEQPAVFFWLGRSAQAAGRLELAEQAYTLALQVGVGREFSQQAAQELIRVRQSLSLGEASR